MRHSVSHRKFSRTSGHRRALLRNLATSLILKESFETTVAKAKDLRGVVERLITLAKNDTLANRRRADSYLQSKDAVKKLFAEIAPRFKARAGGYTRVLKTVTRHGDAAPLAVIALLPQDEQKPKKRKTRSARSTAKTAEVAPENVSAEKTAVESVEAK